MRNMDSSFSSAQKDHRLEKLLLLEEILKNVGCICQKTLWNHWNDKISLNHVNQWTINYMLTILQALLQQSHVKHEKTNPSP